jgi:hypothetical protein
MVVSAGRRQTGYQDKAGKDQSFAVGPATRVTVNGKPGRIEDLKKAHAFK